MAPNLATPVLVVDTDLIHKVDTRNVENLFSMWTVFSKCAGSVEQGRRLENLSWRLWNRETFCCEPEEFTTSGPVPIASRTSDGTLGSDIPDLSGSVDSLMDNEEAIESDDEDTATSTPLAMLRPQIVRQDSGASTRSRGCERHINPNDLEKMISNIKQTTPATIKLQGPINIPSNLSSPTLEPLEEDQMSSSTDVEASPFDNMTNSVASTVSPASDESETVVSEVASSLRSSTSVVRGFSRAQASNSYRSVPITTIPSESAPMPTKTIASKNPPNGKNAMFALGGSSQSDASFGASSIESRMHSVQPVKKKPVFALGASSASGEDESSLRSQMHDSTHRSSLSSGRRHPGQAKKQTSFMEQVEECQIGDDNVFEDTEDEDEIDESAIDDDDDSSDWEDDSLENDSSKSSIDQKTFFQRIDSQVNLTSRRSMLTTLLHQGDRAAALGNIASKSSPSMYRSRTSSPVGPSLAASPDSDDAGPLMMKKNSRFGKVAPQATQPIVMTTSNNSAHQLALSPKTTRRNMLASELTASLRRNLLWERQQKNSTASAVLKRRHTAHTDLKDIKEFPQEATAHMDKNLKETQASWNQYFGQGLGEYHSKGW